uniref:GPN-loop GTPase 3 n=1 Tax=Ganoderma boninense TaxID=34458 RepID=A0A5K1K5B8_9APHY|nr:GPN-loop GTPase 3 [Ganoderma boninense]
MLHLTRIIDKATGCIFVPPPSVGQPPDTVDASDKPSSERPNTYSLMTSAAGPIRGPRSDVRDVQEREGQLVQEEAARQKSKIRERPSSSPSSGKGT